MNRSAILAAASLVVLSIAAPAMAADELEEVVSGLQQSSVYVAPDTPGTNADTAATLSGRLDSGDGIVIVILPEGSLEGEDPGQFAASLDAALDGPQIIGLSVGDQYVAYAPELPNGVVSDLMSRADSVSVGPLDTLGTFVRNVHSYQVSHPEAVPSTNASEEGLSGWSIVLIALLTAIVLGIILSVAMAVHSRSSNPETRERFKAPDRVSPKLTSIAQLRRQVHSDRLSGQLLSICNDVEAYFKRNSADKGRDAIVFEQHLDSLKQVVEQYVEVQNDPRYFDSPRELMQQGASAVDDFADYVLQSIRRGNATRLLDYQVNTDILEAQRFRGR